MLKIFLVDIFAGICQRTQQGVNGCNDDLQTADRISNPASQEAASSEIQSSMQVGISMEN